MNEVVNQLAQQTGLTSNVVGVLLAVAAALVIGSFARIVWLFRPNAAPDLRRQRLGSLSTWWALFALLLLVAIHGEQAAIAIFAVFSLLGLREFKVLVQRRIARVRLWWALAYLAIPVHYLLIGFGLRQPLAIFIPVGVLCLLLIRLVITGQTSGFLETAAITYFGLMLIVYLFSHAVLLLALPEHINPAGGAFGLFLFLVLLTECNDIAQAFWGRLFGQRKIAPAISPSKTWEGFLLGGATTVALGLLLAGLLTPFTDRSMTTASTHWSLAAAPALAAGLLIAIGGAFGDFSMAAVKRQAGVKDSGSLLPGQGGVLDRINSLTFTGPLFFYFTYLLYGRGAS